MTFVGQAARQAGIGFGEDQDKRRWGICQCARRGACGRHETARAVGLGDIVGKFAERGVEEGHDFLSRGGLQRQHFGLATKPA